MGWRVELAQLGRRPLLPAERRRAEDGERARRGFGAAAPMWLPPHAGVASQPPCKAVGRPFANSFCLARCHRAATRWGSSCGGPKRPQMAVPRAPAQPDASRAAGRPKRRFKSRRARGGGGAVAPWPAGRAAASVVQHRGISRGRHRFPGGGISLPRGLAACRRAPASLPVLPTRLLEAAHRRSAGGMRRRRQGARTVAARPPPPPRPSCPLAPAGRRARKAPRRRITSSLRAGKRGHWGALLDAALPPGPPCQAVFAPRLPPLPPVYDHSPPASSAAPVGGTLRRSGAHGGRRAWRRRGHHAGAHW